jgi:hypothetical protein
VPHSLAHPRALDGRTLLDELNHRIKNALTQREQHANRAVAARRPRTGRRLKAVSPPPSVPVAGEWANHLAIQSNV